MSKSHQYIKKNIGGRIYGVYTAEDSHLEFLFTNEKDAQQKIDEFHYELTKQKLMFDYPDTWQEKIREEQMPEHLIEQNLTVQPNNSIKAKKI